VIRLLGGALSLGGMLVMAWNVFMTARQGLKAGAVPEVRIPAVNAAHA
jgi:cytochrome c oxidase cbb3-type subunit 1